jgi:AcrR family transcriptional regulator
MLDVARRAGSSKESLYSWFGSREGMIAEVIRRQAAGPNARVAQALDTADDHRAALTDIARGLLELLLSPASLALNRAALGQPELAKVLLGDPVPGPDERARRAAEAVEQFLTLTAAVPGRGGG